MNDYKYLKENDVRLSGVIHVGAHRGENLGEHEALGANKIVWVEANPDVYKELLVTLENSTLDNKTFCVACSDVDDEQVEFHIIYGEDAGHMVGNKGCSSLLKPVGKFESWHRETITQDTITLDSLLSRNNLDPKDYQLLEIDVQGAELLVLKGASTVLENVTYVSTEVTHYDPDYEGNAMFDTVKAFLNNAGFVHVDTKLYEANWGDALFVKRGKE